MAGFGGAGGPGIYNVGALTLLRSTVTSNVTQAVGGGGGVSNAGADAVLLPEVTPGRNDESPRYPWNAG